MYRTRLWQLYNISVQNYFQIYIIYNAGNLNYYIIIIAVLILLYYMTLVIFMISMRY